MSQLTTILIAFGVVLAAVIIGAVVGHLLAKHDFKS